MRKICKATIRPEINVDVGAVHVAAGSGPGPLIRRRLPSPDSHPVAVSSRIPNVLAKGFPWKLRFSLSS